MQKIDIKCPHCQSDLKIVKDKNYYGCPNWLPNNKGCEGTIYWPEETRKKNYPNVQISYKVESQSNKGHFYQVKIYESGDVYCPCYAGQMNRFCFHKKFAIQEIKKIVEIIIGKNVIN